MSETIEIKNAVIECTHLGCEDHGIMTWCLQLKYGSTGQGFGNYALDDWNEGLKRRIGTAWGMESIGLLLNAVGVGSWEKLPGKYIRVKSESGWNGKVVAIGHIVEDKWFSPKEDLAFLEKKARGEA